MAPPQVVSVRARALHAALLEAGLAGQRVPTSDVRQFLATRLGLSRPAIAHHIAAGQDLGLWRAPSRPGVGCQAIEVLRPEESRRVLGLEAKA